MWHCVTLITGLTARDKILEIQGDVVVLNSVIESLLLA